MIDPITDGFPIVGPGQSFATMLTGPFIPSRSHDVHPQDGAVRLQAADMF